METDSLTLYPSETVKIAVKIISCFLPVLSSFWVSAVAVGWGTKGGVILWFGVLLVICLLLNFVAWRLIEYRSLSARLLGWIFCGLAFLAGWAPFAFLLLEKI